MALLGDIKCTKMSPLWSFFFDIILRCLSEKIGGWDQVPITSLKIGYGLIMGKPIDIGEIIFNDLKPKLKLPKVLYPRFISILLIEMLGDRYLIEGNILVPTFIAKSIFKSHITRRQETGSQTLMLGIISILSSPPKYSSKCATRRKEPCSSQTPAPTPSKSKKSKSHKPPSSSSQ